VLPQFAFVLSHYGLLLIHVFLAYSIGRRILYAFNFKSPWDDFSFSTGLGIGCIVFLVMVLGFLHILYAWVIVLAYVACILFCLPVYNRWLVKSKKGKSRKSSRQKRILIGAMITAVLVIVFLPMLLIPLYPTTYYDALFYHLPYAKDFSLWHAIRYTPYNRFPVFTLNMEMLFTLMLVLKDQFSAQLMHFMCLAVTITAVIGWGQRIQLPRAGLFAGVLLLATPQIFMLAGSTFAELGIALFATLGIYSFMIWLYEKDRKWLWLSAVFVGLAVGTKYSSLFFLAILGAVQFYYDIRARNIRNTLTFGIIALAVACPWYIRNAIYTGNPVFPFFGNLFGYGPWSQADLSQLVQEMTSHGTGKSLISFVTMPWNLVYHHELFVENYPLSKAWFWLLPLAIIFGNFKSYTRWLLAFCFGFFVFWFMSAQQLRYLDPILPLLALLIGVGIDRLLQYLPFKSGELAPVTISILIAAFILCPGVQYGWTQVRQLGPLPVTAEQQDRFIQAVYPTQQIYRLLNDRLGTNYRVYAINDAEMNFYCDGVFMGDWFGVAAFRNVIEYGSPGSHSFRDSETVYRYLREDLRADFLLYKGGDLYPQIPSDEFFTAHFVTQAVVRRSDNGPAVAVLFRIVD
jgi:hypothetical protein